MKKFMLLGAAVVMLSVTACKKDYTCTCSVTEDSTGTVLVSEDQTAKLSKKDAEEWCNVDDATPVGAGYTAECNLTK